jgi:hypothetical protein
MNANIQYIGCASSLLLLIIFRRNASAAMGWHWLALSHERAALTPSLLALVMIGRSLFTAISKSNINGKG